MSFFDDDPAARSPRHRNIRTRAKRRQRGMRVSMIFVILAVVLALVGAIINDRYIGALGLLSIVVALVLQNGELRR